MANKILKHKGFTLIETLIGMAVLGVFLSATYSLYMSAQKSQISQDLEVEMQQNARSALDYIAREMRNINTLNCMENTTTPCTTAGDKIQFASMSDLDDPTNPRRIFSWSSGDNILRYSKAPIGSENRQPLADNITTISFNGFDDNNNPTNTFSNIRRISIIVTAQTSRFDPSFKTNRSYTASTSVKKRNS